MKIFEYYIFIDYSDKLIGYIIIEGNKIDSLLLKTRRCKHYRCVKNRKLYLKHIKKTFRKINIRDCFIKIKIKNKVNSLEIYSDLLEFLKENNDHKIFISVDDNQFKNFKRFVKIIDNKTIKIIKESDLKKDTKEYRLSLVLDNLLNIKRKNE